MQTDLHDKAQDLLHTLANSIHDREPKSLNPFFFSSLDIRCAEIWLMKFMDEMKEEYFSELITNAKK